MQSRLVFFAIIALFALGACGEDDDPVVNQNQSNQNQSNQNQSNQNQSNQNQSNQNQSNQNQSNQNQSNQNQNDAEPITHEFHDEGLICVGREDTLSPGDGTIDAGESIPIHVVFAQCLSSSCSDNFDGECNLVQYGTGIYRVESSGSYDDLSPVEFECTADCGDFSTYCGDITMHSDSVALLHGDHHYYVEPGSERRCIDEAQSDDPAPVERTSDNQGSVCVGYSDPNASFVDNLEADEPFPLSVNVESCLSSSCTEDQQAQCEVEIDGTDVIISTTGSYSDRTHLEDGACTDDCGGGFYADCGELTLGEGTYTLHHGDDTVDVQIPSDDVACH